MKRAATLLALACCLSCTRKQEPAAPRAEAEPADAGESETPQPAYAGFSGEALPIARQLCDAIYELPAERTAACCKSRNPGTLSPLCATTLSAALRSKGVSLDAAAVDRCVAAQGKAHEGCAWVGAAADPLPPECRLLIHGLRRTGELCRSALECGEGQFCLGVGPMDAGRCGPPRKDGQACRSAVDPLAEYTREFDDDSRHGECAGYCGHRKCEPAAALHAKCSLAHECAAGLHCDGEQCAEGELPGLGDKCRFECAFGLVCAGGKCAQPRAEGAACASDGECRGGCLPASHTCGMRCSGR